jgi:regulator of sigma E protease
MVTYLLAGLAMLGVLVFVHEFGHFIVAKAFGVGVPVFSFGMGPRLFGVVVRGTEYRLSAFPVGGYVRMAGADPFGDEDAEAYVEPEQDFMRKPVWQRLLVMLAGPAFNMVLAFLVFLGVLLTGEPTADNSVGTVVAASSAEKLGFVSGDRIVRVASASVETWVEVREAFSARSGAVELVVARGAAEQSIRVPRDDAESPEQVGLVSWRGSARIGVDDPGSPAGRAGLQTGDVVKSVDSVAVSDWAALAAAIGDDRPHELVVARANGDVLEDRPAVRLGPDPAWHPHDGDPFPNALGVAPASVFVSPLVPPKPNSWQKFKYRLFGAPAAVRVPSAEAGIADHDRIFAINGEPVKSFDDIQKQVGATVQDTSKAGEVARSLTVTIVHAGALREVEVTPRVDRVMTAEGPRFIPRIAVEGVRAATVAAPLVHKRYGLIRAVPRAAWQSADAMFRVVYGLYSLVTRDVSPQESLGGAISIFRMAGQSFEAGAGVYFRLLAMISMNLGVVNLLPVPLLDGGQIVFYALEWVRGRPLPVAVRERIQMVGVLALAALMLAVMMFDVDKWFSGTV